MHLRLCRLSLFLFLSAHWLSAIIIKTQPAPSVPTLQQLTRRAGYIFSGTVLSVERVQSKAQNEIATVRITFRVDQAVRGVSSRQIFTIHEWAGLWESGDRYRKGEKLLLFLYQSSKLGLTSPVNGACGRFKLDSSDKILLNATRLAALQIGLPVSNPAAPSGTTSIPSRDLVRAIRRAGD